MKLSVAVTDFKPFQRNTLVGFAAVRVSEMRLTIRDIAVHWKGAAGWAQLPAKLQITRDGTAIIKDGKVQYSTILEFDSREFRDAFSRAVLAALAEFLGEESAA